MPHARKLVTRRRAVTTGAAAILLTLAILVAAAPDRVPGLVVPGGEHGAMPTMHGMR